MVPTTVDFPANLPAIGLDGGWQVAVDGVELALSNLDKRYWEAEGHTKADVLAYYYNAAAWILPYLRDRPLTMKRMPEGADGEFFYAKQAPPHTPEWVATAPVVSLDSGKRIDYVLAQDTATLLWLANLGCIELHPWHARVDRIDRPDYAFFDLDPFEVGFATVRQVALLVAEALERLGLRGYPRTSGATGMQVFVPIERVHSAAAVRRWVERVCRAINQADPDRTTMQWSIADRTGKVYLDYGMNTEGRNIASAYSLRPERAAPVATPLAWEEVDTDVEPSDFTMASIWDRLAVVGDLHAPVLRGGQDLRAAMEAVGLDPGDDGSAGHEVAGRAADSQWMVVRAGAPEQLPPPPPALRPMLASDGGGRAFDDPDWLFEVKWDGIRAIAVVQRPGSGAPGSTRLTSRAGNDLTPAYPELADLWERVLARNAVLDCEIVALDADGRASFQRLQRRMHVRDRAGLERLRRDVGVTLMVFDLLAVDGEAIVDLPLSERVARLAEVLVPSERVRLSEGVAEHGIAMFEAARAHGIEGLIAKRRSSPYRPGKRSDDWRKLKVRRRTQCVIGGWLPGEGARSGRLGSLLVGCFDDGALRYVGRVGTGFDEAELERLGALLAERAVPDRPFAPGAPAPRGARWVRPDLVCRVEYAELTDDGILRAPSYKGMVGDAQPPSCSAEGSQQP